MDAARVRKACTRGPGACEGAGGGRLRLTFRSAHFSYKVGDAAGTQPSNKQAASAFLEQYFKPTDLQEFYKLFFGTMSGKTIKVVGDPIGSNAGVEASLGALAYATCSMTKYSTQQLAYGMQALNA